MSEKPDNEQRTAARLARKAATRKLAVDVRLLQFLLDMFNDVVHNGANQVTKMELADGLEAELERVAAKLGDEAQDDAGSQGDASG